MTVLVDQIQAELLRWLYALSTRRWSDALTELTLGGLVATFVLTVVRLRGGGGGRRAGGAR